MVDRINFLESSRYVITYKKMIYVIVTWVAFCFCLFVLQSGYRWYVDRSVEKHNQYLAGLNSKKERTMALIEATKVQSVVPEVGELSEVYEHFPVWSKALSVLASGIPSQVWLTEIRSEYYAENAAFRKIILGGKGQNTAAVVSLVRSLNENEMFNNIVLNKSTRSEETSQHGYSFVLLGKLIFGAKEWN